jgi:UDP-2-acetamido-2,6-beta-L-arabino-hexul-4-ose reductase
MKILVTGANGFIGKNLIVELRKRNYDDICEFDVDTNIDLLDKYCKECNYIFHLAGVNRPQNQEDFMTGNFGFTSTLLDMLKKNNNSCPIMLASSVQAKLDNPYGKSKKAGEDLLFAYSKETGAKVKIFRFPNVFGKWCRPNYNSAVATFCHNIAHDYPISISDPELQMTLVYIDDVVNELIDSLKDKENKNGQFCEVSIFHQIKLGEIVRLIESFKLGREKLTIPLLSDPFTKKLYATYLSYLPEQNFSYLLNSNTDNRGSFSEFIKTPDRGQISVNISKPGITKGNHWHQTKNEKFLVVSGKGVIRFRKIDSDKIIEYFVSEEKLEVVEIPPGYTHNISNIGEKDMVTIMWASELFDPNRPDTVFLEV